MRKPPPRRLRPDRRVSFIVPPALVPSIEADLAQGWSITGVVLAALRIAYPSAEAPVAPRNGPAEGRE